MMKTKVYAYKNKDRILDISSSGGAFLGIADAFLTFKDERDPRVYGAAFDNDFNVGHSSADTLEGCQIFCGSKYVQSDFKSCFQNIISDLKAGNTVLFTGTPCQVVAVRAYVERQLLSLERIYTVDIVCHGTPNAKFWREYVAYLEKKQNAKLIKFSFRYKPKGWKGYPTYAEFSNSTRRINTLDVSTYTNLFLQKLLIREDCFHCRYPGNFQSDLTIGDFWGVELCMPEIPTKGGVSIIISHTEKGEEILSWMNKLGENQEILLKETQDTTYLKYNHNLATSTEKPVEYQQFWNDYDNNGMEYVLRKYGGDNTVGKLKFYTKRLLRDSGMMTLIKKATRRA